MAPSLGRTSSPLVSIVIVNYNGEPYLQKLLQSLGSQTFRDFEVVIVDNLSHDKSIPIIETFSKTNSFPIKLLANKENSGFCRGNNLGVRASSGEFIVFLNNDTYVDPKWLEELMSSVAHPDAPAAVANAVVTTSTDLIAYGTSFDFYGASFAIKDKVSRFFYTGGVAMLVRKNVFWEAGGFDEILFMYQDEVDLCWRIRLLGYSIGCAPKAICYHIKNETGNFVKDPFKVPIWKFHLSTVRNRIRILLKNYSGKKIAIRLPLAFALISGRILMITAQNRNPRYIVSGAKGFLWNLTSLDDTLRQRHFIQKARRVTDEIIDGFMLPYSVEALALTKLFNAKPEKAQNTA